MKQTIAKKIGLLLLLFNLTGVFALVSVSWLIERRSNESDLRATTRLQQRISRQLQVDLAALSGLPSGSSAVQKDIEAFEAGLKEIDGEVRGSQSYGELEPVSQRLEDLRAKWSTLKTSLLGDMAASGIPGKSSAVVEASNRLSTAVSGARNREREARIFYVLVGACLLNTLLFLSGIWFVRRHVTQPIHLLNCAVRALQSGELQEVPVVRNDELAGLTRAFNEMSDGLQEMIEEKTRATNALMASEARYRLLFDSNPNPMWVFDKETLAFLEVNPAALDHYGYSREDFLSKTILDIRPKEDVPNLLEKWRSGESMNRQLVWRHQKRDGTIMFVRVASHDIAFNSRSARLAVIDDISEQRHLEEQLMQSQKMEAIGRLSGGVAHDFNNILTVIVGHSSVLLESDLDDANRSSAEAIRKAADRATSLTRQLLAFSRKQFLQPVVVNPNRVVKSACEMVTRLIGEHIQVRTFISSDVSPVRVDPAEMEQVIINLAVNARDAMPNGGTLTIATENVMLEKHPDPSDETFQPGQYVLLSVKDTGCGMDEKTKARIFEPFFTTKPRGQGTGLGLSTAYGIVRQSTGIVTVDSKPGEGTEFRIYLPGVNAKIDEPVPAPKMAQAGSETILVVEDEDVVRDITVAGLKKRGYNVIGARDASAARLTCEQTPKPIHLLLTDVIMPEMNGAELARLLKTIRPEMQVLFMSGYTDDALKDLGVSDGSVSLINKPFSFDQLHHKVRQVLDKKAAHV